MFPGAGVSLTESSRGSWQSFGTASALSPWIGLWQQERGMLPTPQGCCEGTVPAPAAKSVPETPWARLWSDTGERKANLGEEQVHEESTGRAEATNPSCVTPGSPSTSSSSWEIPAKKIFGEERANPSSAWAGGITAAMGTGVGSSVLDVSRMATLSEGGNLSFTHLFPVFKAAPAACGSGHPQEDSCTWTRTPGLVLVR